MFKHKKSQMAIIDLFIAIFVFSILVVMVIFIWNKYGMILTENNEYGRMQIITFQRADLLVKSKGDPRNWEDFPAGVDVIGLAESDRNISIEKVDAFINLSYNTTLKSMGLELYDFYFQLKHINGTKLAEHGNNPNNTVVNVQRLVTYKNEKAIVEFAVWK